MAEPDRDHGALRRLRDLTGELRRPRALTFDAEFDQLIDDEGHLDRTEQLRIMATLLPAQNRKSIVRFALMLTLSVTIAVMGLAANSAAVVIGAMLIAPLMTPIMTFSASVGLGLGKRAIQAAFLVIVGATWSVVFAIILARLLPTVTIGSEVLSRTQPDVRDLIVAIAAGAAGAYATARQDMSGALPGVAVAVALVPPLAATGILIDADRRVQAEGSALLFITNLLAIIVSALVVLLATGVIPTIRMILQSSRIALTAVVIVLATVLIAVPLTSRSLDAASSSREEANVAAAVDDWIGNAQLDVTDIAIEGSTVTVELTGLEQFPPPFELAQRLVPMLGDQAQAIVRWDQRDLGIARADIEPPEDPVDVARAVIDNWIAGLAADGVVLDVIDVDLTDGVLTAVVSGRTSPPAAPGLPDEVATAIGADVELKVRYIQSFDPGLAGEPTAVRLERFVRTWIGARSSVRYVAASIDSSIVVIDLAADGKPQGLDVLQRLALDAVTDADRVEIRLLPLSVVDVGPDEADVPLLD
jgi:uncharacterized hydrophobic protein (TIGR00271 family)